MCVCVCVFGVQIRYMQFEIPKSAEAMGVFSNCGSKNDAFKLLQMILDGH